METNFTDFVEYKHNEIQFDDHDVIYNFMRQSGKKYYQSVTIRVCGEDFKKNYTQYEDESCFGRFYEEYEQLCYRHNVSPASEEFFGIRDLWLENVDDDAA